MMATSSFDELRHNLKVIKQSISTQKSNQVWIIKDLKMLIKVSKLNQGQKKSSTNEWLHGREKMKPKL